jgi:PAS domain S-box-containing protein
MQDLRAEASLVSFRIDADSPFQLAIDASPSGIVVIDTNGAIVLVNLEFVRQFGYTRHELLGRPACLVLPGEVAGPGLQGEASDRTSQRRFADACRSSHQCD